MVKKRNTKKSEKLHDKSKAELLKLLKNAQSEWMKLKMDLKIGKLKNVNAIKKTRKQIARIKTIIREKELMEKIK